MNARGNITKSKAGHYTVTLRDEDGHLVSIQDKLATLADARKLLTVLKQEHMTSAHLHKEHQ